MNYKINSNQKDKLVQIIQNVIDSELVDLKRHSEEGDLSYDEKIGRAHV